MYCFTGLITDTVIFLVVSNNKFVVKENLAINSSQNFLLLVCLYYERMSTKCSGEYLLTR
jgi:hypothetical protein